MMPPDRCSFCGTGLPLGGVKYNVHIRIASAFDGYLPEADEENDEERRERIEKLIRSLDSISAEEAEAEVFQDIELVLCPPCRKRLADSLSSLAGREVPSKTKQDTLLQ